MSKSLQNNASDEVKAEWDRMNFQGELWPSDRIILKAIFDNPTASHSELSEITGIAKSAITRRMQRENFIKARQLWEGTVSTKMNAAAEAYARIILRTITNAEEPVVDKIDRLVKSFGDDTSGRKLALEFLAKGSDPWLVHEMGKVAIGFLAKEAELRLKAREIGGERKPIATPEEARAAIMGDFAMQEDGPAEEIEPL